MKGSASSQHNLTLPPEDEAVLRRALEEAGCRFTRQRAAVFAYLRSVKTHPTADEVYTAVRSVVPSISLATVYKSLEALVACRLAAKLPGDGPARYDCRTDNHFHLRCLRTGQIRDLDAPPGSLLEKLEPEVLENLRRQGFHVTDYRLELLGYFEPDAASAVSSPR
ncbi:MAG: transcriptional repressor [Gemmatales bacterium]|nr:transcriptional repressor [Gemmatales bacterium]MDW8386044.1 transcriptional repressor [Gemmatales bacterium]